MKKIREREREREREESLDKFVTCNIIYLSNENLQMNKILNKKELEDNKIIKIIWKLS